jgi:hypothetical protein
MRDESIPVRKHGAKNTVFSHRFSDAPRARGIISPNPNPTNIYPRSIFRKMRIGVACLEQGPSAIFMRPGFAE